MRTMLFLFIVLTLSTCSSDNRGSNQSKPSGGAPKSRTLMQTAEDTRISIAIHLDLVALELYKPIKVQVKNGKVIYTGSVPTEKDSLIALGVAWKQNGVKEVVNNLKVESKSWVTNNRGISN